MRASALFAIAVTAWASLFIAAPAAACSVCGCDPASATLGLDRPGAERVRLSLESRFLRKESGTGHDAEAERQNQTTLRLQYSPLERLTLQTDIPVFLWKRHYNVIGVMDDNAQGLGDVAFSGRYEVLRMGDVVPRHVLALTAGLKLPTGANDRQYPGEPPDEHLQPGSGTYDTLLGLTYLFGDFPWAMYASVNGRLNGTNARSFHYGNALFATVGVRRTFFASEKLILSLEGQARWAAKDSIDGGAESDGDSGGHVYYATPSAAFAITDQLRVRGTVQFPLLTALHGTQSEHTVFYLQFAYDFSL